MPKIPCTWTQKYIERTPIADPWQLHGEDTNFMLLLLNELGNIGHLDRLTIMQGRPNGKKGRVFTGSKIIDVVVFKDMTDDEQLQNVKDIGLVFTYLSNPDVWSKFCTTYEALYELFSKFDDWYVAYGYAVTVPSPQAEWKDYISVALDSAALVTQAHFDELFEKRRSKVFGVPFTSRWLYNKAFNRKLLTLPRTCNNLDDPRHQ